MDVLITPESELDKRLRVEGTGECAKLYRNDGESASLPGQPRIDLNTPDLVSYLDREHLVPDLDRLSPKLWLVSSR